MRKATTIDLTETDRQALSAIVTDRNSPVWRAQIVLLTTSIRQSTLLSCRSTKEPNSGT